MADMFEEGIKAAGKAEYIGALPDSTFMGGATIRDKMRGALRNLGMDNRGINALIGDMRDEDLIDNIGILDLTPAMLPAVIQEGSRSIKQGDYLQGGLDLGFSAIEMAPFAALVSKPLKGFLKSLGTKSMTKETPIDPSRRTAMATMAAAPIAATALSDIPVGKIIDDVIPSSDIPDVNPVAKKITGVFVKNVGQPEKTTVINELLEMTEFGDKFNYGGATDIKNDVSSLSRELNKAKKYFELKNKAETADELDMLSPNNDIADHLDFLQREFGYSNDEVINFIDETNSITRKNANVWETYLRSGSEGDPDVGKALGLGDESENWENWYEDDLFEKIYGSDETDIAGNTIQKKDIEG